VIHWVLLIHSNRQLAGSFRTHLETLTGRQVVMTHLERPSDVLNHPLGKYSIIAAELSVSTPSDRQIFNYIREKTPKAKTVVIDPQNSELHRFESYELGANLYLTGLVPANLVGSVQQILQLLQTSEHAEAPERTFTLVDWIGLKCQNGERAQILVEKNGQHGEIRIHEGLIWDACIGPTHGKAALYNILLWENPTFSMAPAGQEPPRTIKQNWHNVLLEFYDFTQFSAEKQQAHLHTLGWPAPIPETPAPPPPEPEPTPDPAPAPETPAMEESGDTAANVLEVERCWVMRLSRNRVERQIPEDTLPDKAFTFEMLAELGELAMKLDAPMFHRATFYSPTHIQELVYDGLFLMHGFFKPDTPEESRAAFMQQLME
jgi:hypothetical protein